jgi:hypothetical protein
MQQVNALSAVLVPESEDGVTNERLQVSLSKMLRRNTLIAADVTVGGPL